MGFLEKLLGRGGEIQPSDPHGIYVYVQCDNCGEKLRIRADKRHDLMRNYQTDELIWKKEIMETEEGKEALGKAYQWEGLEEHDDSFYDPFRQVMQASGLGIDALQK